MRQVERRKRVVQISDWILASHKLNILTFIFLKIRDLRSILDEYTLIYINTQEKQMIIVLTSISIALFFVYLNYGQGNEKGVLRSRLFSHIVIQSYCCLLSMFWSNREFAPVKIIRTLKGYSVACGFSRDVRLLVAWRVTFVKTNSANIHNLKQLWGWYI